MYIIHERLQTIRYERGLSQAYLAKKLGISATTVNAWETATSKPHVEFVIKLAKFFNVTTDYLLGMDDAPYLLDISELTATQREELLASFSVIKAKK